MKIPNLTPVDGKRGEYEIRDANGASTIIKLVHWGSFAKRFEAKRGRNVFRSPWDATAIFGMTSATPCTAGVVALRTSDAQTNPAFEAPLPELYKSHQDDGKIHCPADVDRLVEYLGRSTKAAVDAVKQIADCIESMGDKMWEHSKSDVDSGTGGLAWSAPSPAEQIMKNMIDGLNRAAGSDNMRHDAGALYLPVALKLGDEVYIDVSDEAPENVTLVLYGLSKDPIAR